MTVCAEAKNFYAKNYHSLALPPPSGTLLSLSSKLGGGGGGVAVPLTTLRILKELHCGDLSNCFKRSERIIDELNFYKLFFLTKYDFF